MVADDCEFIFYIEFVHTGGYLSHGDGDGLVHFANIDLPGLSNIYKHQGAVVILELLAQLNDTNVIQRRVSLGQCVFKRQTLAVRLPRSGEAGRCQIRYVPPNPVR